jgi:hypothetical protein
MLMKKEDVIRAELLALLRGGNAHMTFEEVVEKFPPARVNDRAPHMPYAAWHLLEHMRIVQWDILAFIQDPDHVSPDWPEGYFPESGRQADASMWKKTVRSFLADRGALERMATDRAVDLFKPIVHAKDYTVYREMLLAADHNAYHTGELALMRQVLQAWPPGKAAYGQPV